MTKLEAQLIKAALIWHAVKVFSPRYPSAKEDKALRHAASAFLKSPDEKRAAERLRVALKR
jgi:hypothetical protein